MRCNQTIRRIPQRIVTRQWLWISDVQGSATNFPGLEGLNERGLVNYLTARDVGDVGAGWVGGVEKLEFGSGDEVSCCFTRGLSITR
jgi:hypothetical protein